MEEDEKRKEAEFSIRRNCRGFYLPEMAFPRSDTKLLKDSGYRWTVIDDEAFVVIFNSASVPFDHIITWNGFKTYMRSGLWSNRISSGNYSLSEIQSWLEYEFKQWTQGQPAYVILAIIMDF